MGGKRFGIGISTLAMAATMAAATPAGAATTTVTGDVGGKVRSLATASLVMGVESSTSGLRLLRSHWLKVMVGSKTTIVRNGKRAKLSAVKVGDSVTARVRCSFTITSASTRITCTALRLNATAAPVVQPVTFVLLGTVAEVPPNALAVSGPSFEADERAVAVTQALAAKPPVLVSTDSATVVRLGDAAGKLADLALAQRIRATVTCQPALPYNCRAERIEIVLPKAQPVTFVGIMTFTNGSTLTLDVESAVHSESSTINVQMLRIRQLQFTVPSGTPVLRGSEAAALTSFAPGLRITVDAHCRLEVPFGCVADRVTSKG